MITSRIAGFDGVRALAVVSVVLTHYGAWAGLEDSPIYPLVHGVTGVRAFFVLSGFLITRLLLQEYQNCGRISYRRFLARRALRIFPLYFLFLSLVTLLYLCGYWKTDPSGLPYAWLYIYNFVPPNLYAPLLAHTWSLAVEEHFYLLWPLALLFLLPRANALIVITVLCAIMSFTSYFIFTRWMGLQGYFFERWTPIAAFSLLAGCFAALLVNLDQSGTRILAICRSRYGIVTGILLFLMPSIMCFTPVLAHHVAPTYLAVSLQAIGIAVILIWLEFNQNSCVVCGLEWGPIGYLGRISYGIYIWQGFFLAVSPDRMTESPWPPDPTWGLVGIAIAAPLSYHLYEKQFLNLKHRFSALEQRARLPSVRLVRTPLAE